VWITSSLSTARTPTVVALGNFDGVHRGHQKVLAPIFQTDLTTQASAAIATVVTFSPHPRAFFSGEQQPLLTPLDEKVAALTRLQVQQLVLLPFNRELADLTPQDFVQQILVEGLNVQHISVGQDFCFGRDRSGTSEDLQAIAAQFNIPVTIVPLYTEGCDRISSSAIRTALAQGNIPTANTLLGRAYSLHGTVVHGQQLGRTLGFPTANLEVPAQKLLPRQGVYAVWVEQCDCTLHPGVMNLGQRPTVNGRQQTLEVHLLDWAGDLYGQSLTVRLVEFLRPEQAFSSLDELRQQIHRDCQRARQELVTPA
jgi:riboflavin kinase/FMN adenylyltransferase